MKNTQLFSRLISEQLVWEACEKAVVSAPSSILCENSCELPFKLALGTTSEWFSKKKERFVPPLMITALLLSKILSEQNKYILWVGEDVWPTPHLLATTNLLHQSLFIKSPDEKLKLWTIDTALQSQGVGAVISHCKNIRFALSQRFALEAKRSGAIGVFFLPFTNRLAPSAATSRWMVESTPSDTVTPDIVAPAWKVELLKCKGSLPAKRLWTIKADKNLSEQDLMQLVYEQQKVSLRIPAEIPERFSVAV